MENRNVFEMGGSKQKKMPLALKVLVIALLAMAVAWSIFGTIRYELRIDNLKDRLHQANYGADNLKRELIASNNRVDDLSYERTRLEQEIKQEHLKRIKKDPAILLTDAYYLDKCYGYSILEDNDISVKKTKDIEEVCRTLAKNDKVNKVVYDEVCKFLENKHNPYQPFTMFDDDNYRYYIERLLPSAKENSSKSESTDPTKPEQSWEKDPNKAPIKNMEPNDNPMPKRKIKEIEGDPDRGYLKKVPE